MNKYTYNAFVSDAYDGDSITVDIDLGFGLGFSKQKIRLFGIDTPEIKGEERESGLAARDWLREQIFLEHIVLETIKDKKGKYGRWLGIIHYKGRNLNEELIELGYAVKAEY